MSPSTATYMANFDRVQLTKDGVPLNWSGNNWS